MMCLAHDALGSLMACAGGYTWCSLARTAADMLHLPLPPCSKAQPLVSCKLELLCRAPWEALSMWTAER